MELGQKPLWRQFDLPLLLAALLLAAVGVVMIYSSFEASLPVDDRQLLQNLVFRQLVFAGVGLVAFFVFAALDYRVFAKVYRWVYAFVLASLLFTLSGAGSARFGSRAWIEVGFFSIQFSELNKVLLVTVLARLLDADRLEIASVKPFLTSALLVLPPALLIYRQPDLGMALLVLFTWLGMAMLAGVPWRCTLALVVLAAVVAPMVWHRLEDYMRLRVVTLLFPDHDPLGASYNVRQALISIGSGGVWGKGLLQGTQAQLFFLRVRHTDFIFAVLAEELGFVGAVLLLALFVFVILRLVHIATQARDAYGRLIVSGVAVLLFVQVVVNIGMNANLLPATGLALPLISYGGSSLVTTLMGLGLAESVAMRRKQVEFELTPQV